MANMNLAIASVPVQEWERVYDECSALLSGTIFPELDMPFFAAEQPMETSIMEALRNQQEASSPGGTSDCSEREKDMLKIMTVSFFLDDLRLFLDTHPSEPNADTMKNEFRAKRKQLLADFAQKYYPLTADCEGCWLEGPMPWEGACI